MSAQPTPHLRDVVKALLGHALAAPGHAVGDLLLLAETALLSGDDNLLRSALGRLAHALAEAEAAGTLPSPAELRAAARLDSRVSWRLSTAPASGTQPAPDPKIKCSFCAKSQDQVAKVIAGPGVYICDECVALCNDIIEEERADPPR